jgi:hypothetical protein
MKEAGSGEVGLYASLGNFVVGEGPEASRVIPSLVKMHQSCRQLRVECRFLACLDGVCRPKLILSTPQADGRWVIFEVQTLSAVSLVVQMMCAGTAIDRRQWIIKS